MKTVIFMLPILLALVVASAISIMIFRRAGEAYRDAGGDPDTYVHKSVFVFGIWCVISLLVMLFLWSYINGPDYVIGYEPPIVSRAMKYLGLVAAYGLIGSVLVWWMKQKEQSK
jgi:uncharacterized membrane protein SpoIIM required for sporulation